MPQNNEVYCSSYAEHHLNGNVDYLCTTHTASLVMMTQWYVVLPASAFTHLSHYIVTKLTRHLFAFKVFFSLKFCRVMQLKSA